jgi:hypothetical protein
VSVKHAAGGAHQPDNVAAVGNGSDIRWREPPDHVLAEIAAALTKPGCPLCRHAAETARQFFTWFRIENCYDPPMIARMRAAGGMCPAHTRRLIGQPGADARLTTVYRYVLPAIAARRWHDEPPGPCPACDALARLQTGAAQALWSALRDTEIRRRYAGSDGLCGPHLATLAGVDPDLLALLATVLADRLRAAEPALPRFAGADDDAPPRRRLRALLPAAGMAGNGDDEPPTTVERQRARLATGACPGCLAEGQAERRYLDWLAGECGRDPDSLANEPGRLCAGHLHDLVALDTAAAQWATAREHAWWLDRLAALLDRLDAVPPRSPIHRLRWARARPAGSPGGGFVRRVLASRAEGLVRARTALHGEVCLVCRAVHEYAVNENRVLLAALGLESFASAYRDSAGLCLRHVRALARRGPLPAAVVQLAATRLGLLIAEIEIADRKRTWLARHEASGPEATAWVRAPSLVDGRVFLGGRPDAAVVVELSGGGRSDREDSAARPRP